LESLTLEGWEDDYYYKISDQLSPPAEAQPNTPINESFETPTYGIYTTFKWLPGSPQNDQYPIYDDYSVPPSAYRYPQPVWRGYAGWQDLMYYQQQTYKAGSLTSGIGVQVDVHTLNMMRGDATQDR